MKLDTLFNPHAVAVIGASNDPTKVGYALMKNILDGGTREVYPITLNEKEVLGHVAYRSILDVSGDIDIAIIAVRADIVALILKECAQKGIDTAIVISAGFKEVGEKGKTLEENIARIAKEEGITLLGPNCLGVMNTHTQWNASFAVSAPRKGSIAFISQSGALGTAMLDWANQEGVGFSKFVSLGNEAIINELHFLDYLIDDADTNAVLLYVEQVTSGDAFMEHVRTLTEKKPLVVLHAGKSERGARAVASHTGSLASSSEVFDAALQQAGAISVDTTDELFGLAKLFALDIRTPLQRIAIITNGGGPSVNTTDLIEASTSLALTAFDQETKDALANVLPPMASVHNPVDMIGDANPDRYDATLSILTKQKNIDALCAIVTPQMMTDPKRISEVLIQHRDKKPIIPIYMGGETMDVGKKTLIEEGAVSFLHPSEVVSALDLLATGAKKPHMTIPQQKIKSATHTMMDFEEMRTLLDDYDIPLEGVFVQDKAKLSVALKKLGDGPYAMKVVSKDVIHKSDIGAVATHLKGEDDIKTIWGEMCNAVHSTNPRAHIDGMLIQTMQSGVECIIGMKRDATFGAVIVFGLGGIFVEVMKDTALRIAPITATEARTQIESVKGYPILSGVRGMQGADIDALARVISSLSHLAIDYPNIQAIDLNPVFATPSGAHIVDARIMC